MVPLDHSVVNDLLILVELQLVATEPVIYLPLDGPVFPNDLAIIYLTILSV